MKYYKGIFVESDHIISQKRLTTEIYAEAMSSLIIACADAVIISNESKAVYLAKRSVSPMRGYWTIGGRRFAGEAAVEAVRRNLLRETGVDADEARFSYVTTLEVIWRDRKEVPVEQGKHDIIQFFSIALSEQELLKANATLLPSEYEAMSLRPFFFDDLVRHEVNPVMRYLHKAVFPER
jgi:ADP-ribose pyrophosphatase YjhB (NUDIX family)